MHGASVETELEEWGGPAVYGGRIKNNSHREASRGVNLVPKLYSQHKRIRARVFTLDAAIRHVIDGEP